MLQEEGTRSQADIRLEWDSAHAPEGYADCAGLSDYDWDAAAKVKELISERLGGGRRECACPAFAAQIVRLFTSA